MVNSDAKKIILYFNKYIILLSFVAYGIGVGSFFYYPDKVARETYVSENALMPGCGRIEYDQNNFQQAVRETKQFLSHAHSIVSSSNNDWAVGCANWIARAFEEKGLDANVYLYANNRSKTPSFQPVSHEAANSIGAGVGVVVTGILRAGKGDGTEGLVVSSLFTHQSDISYTKDNLPPTDYLTSESAGGVGMLLSISEFLRNRKWLAKDILFVVADSSKSIECWLRAYHGGELSRWGGALQANLHISLRPWPLISKELPTPPKREDSIVIHMDGSNGQLPNLDIVNALTHFAKVRTSITLPMYPIMPFFDAFVSKFELPRTRYVDVGKLFAFMTRQAIGVPQDHNGPHPYFNRYNIDSISLDVDRETNQQQYEARASSVFPLVIIGTLRSLNNILEHLHQSFYYYLLSSPVKYVSIGDYMISFGLILAPLLVYILFGLYSLFVPDGVSSEIELHDKITPTPPAVISATVNAISAAIALYLCGLVFYSVPLLVADDGYVVWAVLAFVAVFSFLVIHTTKADPKIFMLFITIPALVFVAAMSLLNYSFCVFAAVVVVPIYTLCGHLHAKLILLLQLLLVLVSTPSVLYCLGLISQMSPSQLFATILGHHVQHGTLLYPFITLVYTPLNCGYLFMLWKVLLKNKKS